MTSVPEKFQHPWRNAPLHTFQRVDSDGKGFEWIALFYPYTTYTVFHHGKTEAEAKASAFKMRDENVLAHEASYIARKIAQEKAAASRAKKKTEKDTGQ